MLAPGFWNLVYGSTVIVLALFSVPQSGSSPVKIQNYYMYKKTKNLQLITVIKDNNSFKYLQGKNLSLQDKTIQY